MGIFSLLSRREKVFVWEVGPRDRRGVLLSIDEERKIKAVKIWTGMLPGFIPNEMRYMKHVPVIITLHPSMAWSAWNSIKFKSKKGISLSGLDFEDVLSEALGDADSRYRPVAGKFLEAGETDTVLIDARAFDFTVDGAVVPNPVGFSGRNIEGGLRSIFTRREIFHEFSDMIHKGRPLFFTERGSSEMFLMDRLEISDNACFLLIDTEENWFFPEGWPSGTRKKKRTIPGVHDSIICLKKNLGINKSVAENILKKYENASCSPSMLSYIEDIISDPSRLFLDSILKAAKRSDNVYLWGELPVPLRLPLNKEDKFLRSLPLLNILDELAFSTDSPSLFEEDLTYTLAPFAEYYYNEGDPDVHRFLRKRLHWISA